MSETKRPDLDSMDQALAQLTGPVSIAFRDGRVASNDIRELLAYTRRLEAATADAQIVALLERLLPSSGFELHLLHSVVERGPDAWRVARWNVGPVEIATGWSLLEALQALGAEETT